MFYRKAETGGPEVLSIMREDKRFPILWGLLYATIELHFQFLHYCKSLGGVGCPGQSLVGRCEYETVVVSVVRKDFWDDIPDVEIWCWFGW